MGFQPVLSRKRSRISFDSCCASGSSCSTPSETDTKALVLLVEMEGRVFLVTRSRTDRIDAARIATAVRRVKQRLHETPPALDGLLRELAAAQPPREHLRWINASSGTEVKLITVDEVCYFQSDTKYTRVMTSEGESLIRRSLKELTEQLDPAQFWQIHRSTIVNANAIASVSRDFRGRISIKLKSRSEKLPVSEQHEHLFRQM